VRQGNAAGHRDEGDRVEASVEGGAGDRLEASELLVAEAREPGDRQQLGRRGRQVEGELEAGL
jgi:hypothetical protein